MNKIFCGIIMLPLVCRGMEPCCLPSAVEQDGDTTVVVFPKVETRESFDSLPLQYLGEGNIFTKSRLELDPQKETSSMSVLADRIVASIESKGQIILEQEEKTAQQMQQALKELQEGIKEMRCAQTKQRRMAYVSFGVGICGVALFLFNVIGQQLENKN